MFRFLVFDIIENLIDPEPMIQIFVFHKSQPWNGTHLQNLGQVGAQVGRAVAEASHGIPFLLVAAEHGDEYLGKGQVRGDLYTGDGHKTDAHIRKLLKDDIAYLALDEVGYTFGSSGHISIHGCWKRGMEAIPRFTWLSGQSSTELTGDFNLFEEGNDIAFL